MKRCLIYAVRLVNTVSSAIMLESTGYCRLYRPLHPPHFSKGHNFAILSSCILLNLKHDVINHWSHNVWSRKSEWHRVQGREGRRPQRWTSFNILLLLNYWPSPSLGPAAVRTCTFRLAAEMSASQTRVFGPVILTDALWHGCQRCPHPVSYFMWCTRPACHITEGERQSSA